MRVQNHESNCTNCDNFKPYTGNGIGGNCVLHPKWHRVRNPEEHVCSKHPQFFRPKGPGMKKLTEAQAEDIARRIIAGERSTDLAAEYGVHYATIIYHAKKGGYHPKVYVSKDDPAFR